MTRDEILASNPMKDYAEAEGIVLKRVGGEWVGLCPFHGDSNASFRINEDKQTWFCDPCGFGGSVIDFVMRRNGVSPGEAMKKLGGARNAKNIKPELVATYDYTDEHGKMLFQVCRFVPKTFRQRHKSPNGEWVWKMDDVRRVLYHLPEVLAATDVFLVEGEKDADNLRKLGFVATTNPGGAKKWLGSYSESLKGKRVVIVPDNDEAGKSHADKVARSILDTADRVYRFDLLEDKDISDMIHRLGDEAKNAIFLAIDRLKPISKGEFHEIRSMAEMEAEYAEFVKRGDSLMLRLGAWLPSLGKAMRGLMPGELAVVLADTGAGKTAFLQHVAIAASPIPTLIFEIELPGSLMFERFVQMERRMSGSEVFAAYKHGSAVEWQSSPHLHHIFVCPNSKMNPMEMERIINQSELKIGRRPGVVLVDYVGLMAGRGNSRYEKMSDVAEQLKVVAKSTNTVIMAASQVARRGDAVEVSLHDAKDSGSIENSAGLVLGLWREESNSPHDEASTKAGRKWGDNKTHVGGNIMKLKILKNTKGPSGQIITCQFEGRTMSIREQTGQDAGIP